MAARWHRNGGSAGNAPLMPTPLSADMVEGPKNGCCAVVTGVPAYLYNISIRAKRSINIIGYQIKK